MFLQIIAGVAVALISFSFGYLLFLGQRKELLRLELYKRKLAVYDEVMIFLQKVDRLILAKNGVIDPEQRNIMAGEVDDFTYPKRPYLSKELYYALEFELVDSIKGLPESLTELEKAVTKTSELIAKEIGSELIDPRQMRQITGQEEARK